MQIDFHGWKTEDAEQELHNMIGEARMSGGKVPLKLITGHGVIKHKAMEVCEEYGILCVEQVGNSGVLMGMID